MATNEEDHNEEIVENSIIEKMFSKLYKFAFIFCILFVIGMTLLYSWVRAGCLLFGLTTCH